MSDNLVAIIDKVKKLLALSKSDNINEAAAAMSAANKLIDTYRLSEIDLEDSSGVHSSELMEDSEPVYESGRITVWRSSLVSVLATHYGCAVIMYKNYRNSSYKLIGRANDIKIVKYLYAWATYEIERLCKNASSAHSFNKSDGKIFANSFCIGAVSGIRSQLASSRKEVINSASLVKLDNRYDEAVKFMKNRNADLKINSFSSKTQIDRMAYQKGFTSGSQINLGNK